MDLEKMSKGKLIKLIGRLVAVVEKLEEDYSWSNADSERLRQENDNLREANGHLEDELYLLGKDNQKLLDRISRLECQVHIRRLPSRVAGALGRNS